jgi:hypothetical protein
MEENKVIKKLETYLPMDLFEELKDFAKKNTETAFGKFDFGVALRILLLKSYYTDILLENLSRLEGKVGMLENEISDMKHKEEIPKGYREIKTLGDLKIKKEVQ